MSAVFNHQKNTTEAALDARLCAIEALILRLAHGKVLKGITDGYASAIASAGDAPAAVVKAAEALAANLNNHRIDK